VSPTGGRITVVQACLPNIGPGSLKAREGAQVVHCNCSHWTGLAQGQRRSSGSFIVVIHIGPGSLKAREGAQVIYCNSSHWTRLAQGQRRAQVIYCNSSHWTRLAQGQRRSSGSFIVILFYFIESGSEMKFPNFGSGSGTSWFFL
jgi:hypothetical protein